MTLRWKKPDEYHIRSECGGFTVARITVAPSLWYIAFRRAKTESGVRSTEIGATRLPAAASDEQRQSAIRDMQKLCEGEAA